jgi:uncharacterized protein
VHWRAWGPEALDEAQTTGKPILLSIGFTACHWCHVMNAESFEDPEIAALMNELFVNIKVDREERPTSTRSTRPRPTHGPHAGGWPLTMFLTPAANPFSRHLSSQGRAQRTAAVQARPCPKSYALYTEQPEAITNTIARIHQTFSTLWSRDLRANFDRPILDVTAIAVGQRFDIFYGGLTGSTKFPTTGLVEMLWRAFLRTGLLQFPTLVQATLDHMCRGGLYDHVGGGFSHYTVEQRWLVPHFEKMLYDNAGIIDLLTLVWQHNRPPLYRDRIEDTIGWVLRDMMVESAFATSIDSDSEGEEGKYYVWSEAEIDATLAGTFSQRFKESYSVTRAGNYRGANILERTTAAYPLSDADEALLKKQRGLLLAARRKRVAPLRDDKILADWNGMMIAALANAGAVFRKPEWTAAAAGAFDFIVKALGDGDRLYHSWRAGKRGHIGFVDDYAHMARAAYMLWEATGERQYIAHAEKWVRALNEHFWDVQNGGYFYTADDSDPLIDRARMAFDQNAQRQRHDGCAPGAPLFRDGGQFLSRPLQCPHSGFFGRSEPRLHLDGDLSQQPRSGGSRSTDRDSRSACQSQNAGIRQRRAWSQPPQSDADCRRSEPASSGGSSRGEHDDAEWTAHGLYRQKCCVLATDHQPGNPVADAATPAAGPGETAGPLNSRPA